MYKYDEIKDKLFKSGKQISSKTPEFLNHCAKYAIQLISEGRDLKEIPNDSDCIPLLSTILLHIDSDSELAEAKKQAETSRLALLKEDLVAAVNKYKKNPSQENNNLVVALEKVYTKFSKEAQDNETILLHVNKVIEDDFWSKTHIPENPRDKEGKDISAEDYIEMVENA